MFSFNTTKKQAEPNLNSAAAGAFGKRQPSQASAPMQNANFNGNNEYLNARVEEIEAQRRDFMKRNPSFDMKAEMQNPQFVTYVWKNNLSIEDAYFLVHRDEVIESAVSEAFRRMDERRGRITENGAGKLSPAAVKKNPKEMSDKEIDSIIERVRNGENISF